MTKNIQININKIKIDKEMSCGATTAQNALFLFPKSQVLIFSLVQGKNKKI